MPGSISLKVNATESGTSDFGTPQWAGAISQVLTFGDGTTANNIDLIFFDERTVASATNDDVVLQGALETALGTAFDSAEVVAVAVVNAPITGTANTTDLTIGNATNAFEGFLSSAGTVGPIGPGGMFLVACPDAGGLGTVTNDTADELRIANSSGASATYQIAIFTRSA